MHWEIGLKFRDFEVGIPDWDCETKIFNSKFIESLLLLEEKTQEWNFRICIPPYYPVHIMVGICWLLSIFHCLLWKRCIPLRAKVPDILPCFSFRSTWHILTCALELGIAGPKVRVRTGQLENCGSPIQQEIMTPSGDKEQWACDFAHISNERYSCDIANGSKPSEFEDRWISKVSPCMLQQHHTFFLERLAVFRHFQSLARALGRAVARGWCHPELKTRWSKY